MNISTKCTSLAVTEMTRVMRAHKVRHPGRYFGRLGPPEGHWAFTNTVGTTVDSNGTLYVANNGTFEWGDESTAVSYPRHRRHDRNGRNR